MAADRYNFRIHSKLFCYLTAGTLLWVSKEFGYLHTAEDVSELFPVLLLK